MIRSDERTIGIFIWRGNIDCDISRDRYAILRVDGAFATLRSYTPLSFS